MSDVLDKIVNCSISIESPVEDASSFGTILLVGNGPLTGGNDLKPIDRYSSLPEVTEAGWKEDSSMYKAARAAFLQDPPPDLIYIAVRQEQENTSEIPEETETETESLAEIVIGPEPIIETVRRAMGVTGWYGLALVDAGESEYEDVAKLIETTEKIFAFSTQKKKSPLESTDYMRTIGFYSGKKEEYAHIAFMVKGFSFDPGSESWDYKSLTGVTPSELTTREMSSLEENKLSYYITCAGKNITRNGKTIGGEWIDVIRFRDWLQNQMQMRIFELFIKNPKIPYTDSGITLVENQMRAVLRHGQTVGGIAETEYDENENPVYGFTVSVPKAASLSSAQRRSRKLPDCKFVARLAGAIHVVEMRGNLVF